ncbi:MAG: PD40 domain-containing protein [Candidatus Omnitrophica bacterium]|nr:PD40 domain-containing protein [Candidatus Omnitrophota bacterium]
MVRYNDDGSVDNGFGNGGLAVADFGLPRETATGVAIQPEGEIVVSAKTLEDPTEDMQDLYAVRFTSDGDLDTTFSDDGYAAFDAQTSIAGADDVVVRIDNNDKLPKVTLIGNSLLETSGSNRTAIIGEFSADGTPHEAYNGGVRRRIPGTVRSLVPGNVGSLFVVGGSGDIDGDDYQIVLLDDDGGTNFSFGEFGTANLDRGATDEELLDWVRITAVNRSDDRYVGLAEEDGDFLLLGIELGGDTFDEDFGTMGEVLTDFGGFDTPRAIALVPQERILVCGETHDGEKSRTAIAAYNLDGSPDLGFGVDGKVVTDFPEGDTGGIACLLQPDEKLVVGGSGEGGDGFISLSRYGFFGDDEDGVAYADGVIIPLGAETQAEVTVNGSGGSANLFGWIDFDRNGVFDHPGEQVANGMGAFAGLADGPVSVPFTVPGTAPTGNTYSRWRVTTDSAVGPEGEASDGEIEDGRLCFINAPADPPIPCQASIKESTNPGGSDLPDITSDGNQIVFQSVGDLVGNNDVARFQIFHFNRETGEMRQITRVAHPKNAETPVISGDGSWIGFVSNEDFTGENPLKADQVFLYEVATSAFLQITYSEGDAIFNDLSADNAGDRFAFRTTKDLTGDNPDGRIQVFLYDISDATLTQLTDSTQINTEGVANMSLTGNGEKIVFESKGDWIGQNADKNQEIFLLDIASKGITQITQTADGDNTGHTVSDDGTLIAFSSKSELVEPGGTFNPDLILYDGVAQDFDRITEINSFTVGVSDAELSGDGSRILFRSSADLVGTNADAGRELFLYDRATDSFSQVTFSDETVSFPNARINVDGTRVVFSDARDLVGESPDGYREIYIVDLPPTP